MKGHPPTLYLFTGSNAGGKTTLDRTCLHQLDPVPRFPNADELTRRSNTLATRNVRQSSGVSMSAHAEAMRTQWS